VSAKKQQKLTAKKINSAIHATKISLYQPFTVNSTLFLGMKQLIITRHAKSDWGDAGLSDFDRPLNKRGRQDAPDMAKRLMAKGVVPDAIVSSDALRAKSTASLFNKTLKISDGTTLKHEIYHAPVKDLLMVINTLNDQWQTVMLVGHNPGLSELVGYLSGNDIELVTSAQAAVAFEFESWAHVSKDTGKLLWHDFPKNGTR